MEGGINSFHIVQSHRLPEDHLIKSANEKCIKKAPMENRKPYDSADELKVVEMFGVDSGVRIYLKGVVIMRRVFEQTVERVEHIMRKEKEKLSANSVKMLVFWYG